MDPYQFTCTAHMFGYSQTYDDFFPRKLNIGLIRLKQCSKLHIYIYIGRTGKASSKVHFTVSSLVHCVYWLLWTIAHQNIRLIAAVLQP